MVAEPHSTIVSFRCKSLSSYKLADSMKKRGYSVEMQSNPECLHMSVMPQHCPLIDDIIRVIEESLAEISADPSLYENDSKAVYGMLAKIPDEAVVEDFMVHYMDNIYKFKNNWCSIYHLFKSKHTYHSSFFRENHHLSTFAAAILLYFGISGFLYLCLCELFRLWPQLLHDDVSFNWVKSNQKNKSIWVKDFVHANAQISKTFQLVVGGNSESLKHLSQLSSLVVLEASYYWISKMKSCFDGFSLLYLFCSQFCLGLVQVSILHKQIHNLNEGKLLNLNHKQSTSSEQDLLLGW